MSRSSSSSSGPYTCGISVVGVSGYEQNCVGVGKSSLCNRLVRPDFDSNYQKKHISVLSETDFNGRVVNNVHWLYWGHTLKTTEDNVSFKLHIVEHTDFVHEGTFRTFGSPDHYLKRCSVLKLSSSQKLVYICKDQLGLETDYTCDYVPRDGIQIDGFVCVYDVSEDASRRERYTQFSKVYEILLQLLKTKKPIVLCLSKFENCSAIQMQEAYELTKRKELKNVHVVEVSARDNVNVEQCFLLLASQIHRSNRTKVKVPRYTEALALQTTKRASLKTKFDRFLNEVCPRSMHLPWVDFLQHYRLNDTVSSYIHHFGKREAEYKFTERIEFLKEELQHTYLENCFKRLPGVIDTLLSTSMTQSTYLSEEELRRMLEEHPDTDLYFTTSSLQETADKQQTNLIPLEVLGYPEATKMISSRLVQLIQEQCPSDALTWFTKTLAEQSDIMPGQALEEVDYHFTDNHFYRALTPKDRDEAYAKHQASLLKQFLQQFEELLLERVDLFHNGLDLHAINRRLEEEPRFRDLIYRKQERSLTIQNYLSFLKKPQPLFCVAHKAKCSDLRLPENLPKLCQSLANLSLPAIDHTEKFDNNFNRSYLSPSVTWSGDKTNSLRGSLRKRDWPIFVVGTPTTRQLFIEAVRTHYTFQEVHFSNITYRLQCTYVTSSDLISVSVSSLLSSPPSSPLGCVLLLADPMDATLANMFLEQLELQDSKGRTRSIVVLLPYSHHDAKHKINRQDLPMFPPDMKDGFLLPQALLHLYAFFSPPPLPPHRSLISSSTILKITLCFMCGDLFPLEFPLASLLHLLQVNPQTFQGVHSSGKVHITFASYHSMLCSLSPIAHGYILVYWTGRRASLNHLHLLSSRLAAGVPQMVVGVDAMVTQNFTAEGQKVADERGAQFLVVRAEREQHQYEEYNKFLSICWSRTGPPDRIDSGSRRSTPDSKSASITDDTEMGAYATLDSLHHHTNSDIPLDDIKDPYYSLPFNPSGDPHKLHRSISSTYKAVYQTHHRTHSDSQSDPTSGGLDNSGFIPEMESDYACPSDLIPSCEPTRKANGLPQGWTAHKDSPEVTKRIPPQLAICNSTSPDNIYAEVLDAVKNSPSGLSTINHLPPSPNQFFCHQLDTLHLTPRSYPPELPPSPPDLLRRQSNNLLVLSRERRRSFSGPVVPQATPPFTPERSLPPTTPDRSLVQSPATMSPMKQEVQIGLLPGPQMTEEKEVNESVPISSPRRGSFFRSGSSRRSLRDTITRKNRDPDEKKTKEQNKKNKKMQKKSSTFSAPHNSTSAVRADRFILDPTGRFPVVTPFVEGCTRLIESQGANLEGIYRIPGNSTDVDQFIATCTNDILGCGKLFNSSHIIIIGAIF